MQNTSRGQKTILFTLFISTFAVYSPGILTGTLLIDIADTFSSHIGPVSTMRTYSSGIGVLAAILMGVFSVRYKHRTLLLSGLTLVSISAIGCYLAPSLATMFLAYMLTGLGSSIVTPMTNSLIGELFPVERRSMAIGMLIASASLAYVVGAPFIGYINSVVGWRLTFVVYILLLNVIGIASILIALPKHDLIIERGDQRFFEGFRRVMKNRSALACLIGVMFAAASWSTFVYYSVSYFRSSFQLSTSVSAMLLSVIAVFFTAGSLYSGKIAHRYGRRRLTIIGLVGAGILIILFFNLQVFWAAFIVSLVCCIFGGIRYSASNNLVLEQVPEYRGTLMSLNTAAIGLGISLGAVIGGYVLLWYNWGILGLVFGLFTLFSAGVYTLFTVDPHVGVTD